jgi:glycerophosphoryl diester phosphodiesterase
LEELTIIAHRGRTALIDSENTIEAFQSAIDLGIPYIEFDLRRSEDGQILCYHDESIDGIKISDLKYDRILAISQSKGFTIPLFEDILKLCCGKIGLDIEVKEEGYEEVVISIALKYLNYSEFVIKSFNDASVKKIKNLDQNIKVGLLLGGFSSKYLWTTYLSHIFPEYRIFKTGADFVAPNYRMLGLGLLWRMNKIGKEVYIWTVNDEKLLTRFITNRSVAAIITDRSELVMKILADIETK